MSETVTLSLPFTGRWTVRNSPARRVPSHGIDLLGQRYAIDFVGVDDAGSTASAHDWRTVFGTEPAERFVSFGRPILAPTDGIVVAVHDGEPDHAARRSQLALASYARGQASRLRQGVWAIAGNHVIIADRGTGLFVVLVHLRHRSLRAAVGDQIGTGDQIAECGNSGNSTQPHVHVQVMDSLDMAVAHGVPMVFRDFREWPRRAAMGSNAAALETGLRVPDEGSIVEPLTP